MKVGRNQLNPRRLTTEQIVDMGRLLAAAGYANLGEAYRGIYGEEPPARMRADLKESIMETLSRQTS